MALGAGVLSLVLLAALLHAVWNALIKAGGDRLVMTTTIMFVPILPSLLGLFVLPAMAPAAWPFVILSAVVHWIYFGVLIGAYRYVPPSRYTSRSSRPSCGARSRAASARLVRAVRAEAQVSRISVMISARSSSKVSPRRITGTSEGSRRSSW